MMGTVSLLFTHTAVAESQEEISQTDIVGQQYVIDYGAYAYEITVTSAESLHWQQIKGEADGPSSGDNPYLLSHIADGVIFLSWIEQNGMAFYNLMNFNTGKLITHANAGGSFINVGTVSVKP